MIQKINDVRSPIFSYMCIVIGMTICILVTFSAELVGSSTFFVYSMLKSCKTGAATALISSLSMGYFYSFIPVVSLASFVFLCYYWLGSFGVSMGLIGFAVYIPHYMNINLYHSTMNTATMMGYINKSNEESLSTLM